MWFRFTISAERASFHVAWNPALMRHIMSLSGAESMPLARSICLGELLWPREKKLASVDNAVKLHPLVRTWILHLLVVLGGHRQFISRGCIRDSVGAAPGRTRERNNCGRSRSGVVHRSANSSESKCRLLCSDRCLCLSMMSKPDFARTPLPVSALRTSRSEKLTTTSKKLALSL